METLFEDKDVFQKERPMVITADQEIEVLTSVANEIIECNLSSDSVETIVEDLKTTYKNNTSFDIAKELDSSFQSSGSYTINSQLLELLENIDSLIDDKNRQNQKDWVKAHSLQPKLKKGAELIVINLFSRQFKKGQIFFITGIYNETAQYILWEEKDHNGGYVVDFEKVESNCELTS